jgi:hypothetical protein
LAITCGIDWAENHHDVALVDEEGKLVAKRRIRDDADGTGVCLICSPKRVTAPMRRFRSP